MKIEFDPVKSEKNRKERGFGFELVTDFDFSSAIMTEDVRKPYPERRFVAVGLIDARLYVLCLTPIEGGIRVISLRKANSREVKKYAIQSTTH